MSERERGKEPNQKPPSFLPTGSSQRSKRGTSPAPSSSEHSSPRSSRTHSNSQAQPSRTLPSFSPDSGKHASQPAQVPSQPRRSSGRPQIAPAQAARVQQPARRSSGSSRQAAPSRPAHQAALYNSGQRPQSIAAVRKPHKHRARKIVAAVLVLILAVGAFSAVSTWSWIDKQLQHKDMLTDMASGTATSWLILGSDERDGTEGTGTYDDAPGFRTDTILVLTKPRHGAASLISIPRDSLVTVNGEGMKINAAANLGGYRALTSQVEAITGHKIDHAVLIRFGGLEGVVNALGGVNLCYDQTVDDPYSGLNWTAGCHDADGGTALAFSRMRYADPKGDFGRAERQRKVIAAIAQKAASPKSLVNPSHVSNLAKASLGAVIVDESTNPWILARMVLAFRDASGEKGVNGSVYWTDPDYYPGGLGSTVLLDAKRNLDLFTQLNDGTHETGTVGGM